MAMISPEKAIPAFVLALTVGGCDALQRASIAGKYCLANSPSMASCIYLKSDGSGSMTMFGSFGGGIKWTFLEDRKISLTGNATGSGMILDVSDDNKTLSAFGGITKYERVSN